MTRFVDQHRETHGVEASDSLSRWEHCREGCLLPGGTTGDITPAASPKHPPPDDPRFDSSGHTQLDVPHLSTGSAPVYFGHVMSSTNDGQEIWNPLNPLEITPEEYERTVLDWLRQNEQDQVVTLLHREVVKGGGGDYQIDVTAELTIFGATLRILIECKKWRRPVERDHMLAFAMKVQDTGSHKGMMFATSGFQKGAIDFAATRGIATVVFLEGNANFVTASRWPTPTTTRFGFPEYGGWFLRAKEGNIACSWVSSDRTDPIDSWVRSPSEARFLY